MVLRSERSCPALPTICKQSRRAFTSANSDERPTNAPVQISVPGSTISIGTGHHHESLSGGTPSFECVESSAAAISIILDLESGNGSLKIADLSFPINPNSSRMARVDNIERTPHRWYTVANYPEDSMKPCLALVLAVASVCCPS